MKHKLIVRLLVTAFLLLGYSIGALAQQNIKGKVTDAESNPLPGVSVYLKGTTIGVVTDNDGNYSLTNRTGSKTIVFSTLGMKECEEIIGNRAIINVVMEEDKNLLEETVVIGYQEVKRKDLMGAVTSVDSKTINSIPAPSFTEALSGKMAGVNVITTEGDPDATVQIKIRGTGSITQDASPLYIVDGFPVKDISDIAAQDIKSVDVLKDAFSTAIYGSRGAYGVVLITTKDSARGRISASYEGYGGIKVMANKDAYEMMTPYQYASSLYEYYMLEGKPESYNVRFGTFEDMQLYKHVNANDWKTRVFGRVGTTMNHNINISGSMGKSRWSASYTRMDEDAIMINSSYVRNNFSFRGYSNPVKNLSFNMSVRYSSVDIEGSGANSINDKGNTAGTGRLVHAMRYAPIPMDYLSVQDDFDVYSKEFGANPLREVQDNDRLRHRENWNVSGAMTWTIIPNLKLKVEGGVNSEESGMSAYFGLSSYFTREQAAILAPNTETQTEYRRGYRNANTLSYNFNNVFKNKRHKLDLLAGQELNYTKVHSTLVVAQGFPDYYDADMARRYMGTASLITSADDYYNENEVMLSFFGRGNYVYDNRYSVSAAFRADGSSKFSAGNYWGIFPSGAVSWTLSNERWLRRARQLNLLKLRYSVGVAGNNRIPAGQIRRRFTSDQTTRLEGMSNLVTPGTVLPNSELKWERTLSHNVGLDFAFFDQRLSGTMEAYHNTSKDLLINYPLSGVGYTSQYRNVAAVLNRGLELSLRGVIIEKKNFGLTVSGNIALNENKVTSLGGIDEIQTVSRIQATGIGWDFLVKEGRPLGEFYGYESDGWYTVDDFDMTVDSRTGLPIWTPKEGTLDASAVLGTSAFRPGSPKFKDKKKDGKIDSDDKVAIGCAMPKITGGFNIATQFYGFDLSAAFSYSLGGQLYNGDRVELTQKSMYRYKNLLASTAPGNAWTNIDWNTGEVITDPEYLKEVNKDAKTWSSATNANYFLSSEYIEDASFLRLNSLTLGYTIPLKITQWAHISNLRVYVTASNLFCLTKYSGFDPEVNCRRHNPLTPGIDYSAYPKSRAVVGGLSVTF